MTEKNILKKSREDSYIAQFHLKSQLARELFGGGSNLEIVQIMNINSEGYYVAEVRNKS